MNLREWRCSWRESWASSARRDQPIRRKVGTGPELSKNGTGGGRAVVAGKAGRHFGQHDFGDEGQIQPSRLGKRQPVQVRQSHPTRPRNRRGRPSRRAASARKNRASKRRVRPGGVIARKTKRRPTASAQGRVRQSPPSPPAAPRSQVCRAEGRFLPTTRGSRRRRARLRCVTTHDGEPRRADGIEPVQRARGHRPDRPRRRERHTSTA